MNDEKEIKRAPVKLWVDDLRDPPRGQQWLVVRTISEALLCLQTFDVAEVSLDHDIMHAIPQQITIPPECAEGMDVERIAKYTQSLIELPVACPETYAAVAMYIAIMPEELRPHTVWIHTANPVGAQVMTNILKGKINKIIRRHV